jgi:hypothetical protein
MKRCRSLLCWLLIFFALGANADELQVKMRPRQNANDISHDYFIGLAQLALDKTSAEFGPARVTLIAQEMTQARALAELSQGNLIDLDWAGTDTHREATLYPIRIPLAGGLLGYRVPVIRKEDIAAFQKVKTLQDLQQFTAIQGTHWPDTAILESAGLKVQKTPQFKLMYPMLKNKRVDYFPRGLNEVYAEVDSLQDDSLVAYDQLLLVYKLPMYFFTNKNNQSLAQRIEKGLRLAIKDGSMLKYMQSSLALKKVFPLSQYKHSRQIKINNPNLPPETPVNDAALWLDLN